MMRRRLRKQSLPSPKNHKGKEMFRRVPCPKVPNLVVEAGNAEPLLWFPFLATFKIVLF